MSNKSLNELLEKDLVVGYVYGYDGMRQVYYFENSPANIANFIMLHSENADKIILTDQLDRLILNTFGEFINRCPDQAFLQEVLKELVPMQLREKEPSEILSASEDEFAKLLYEEDRQVTEAELRML
ncbi:resolvase [Sinanaerobacter chloroacetimidivorans]|uniref:Resolvase n=1 Tax=Sinanaerobacter chloroacetimidivorans TaxID=2818044 RepID=A0A8J7W386_9FIRM|nr:resolvase [Sinanaerobacter chloroacetimidivorans]MBR0600074.1 resolvase [Sinanaerobacter chloroacetimidivorans]